MSSLSTMTFKDFEYAVRGECGARDPAKPNSDTIRRWSNIAIKKLARLALAIDLPWGRNSSTLTLLNATGIKHDPGGGGSYASTTHTFSDIAGFDQTYVGGWAFWEDRSNSRAFWGLIDKISTANEPVLRVLAGTGAEAAVTSANLLALFKPNPVFYNGANINALNFLDLVKLVDSTNGNVARLDPDVFSGFAGNPHYDSSVVMQYAGDAVYVGKGNLISALGTLTLFYQESPDNLTSSSSLLDILPEHISMVKDEVSRWVLNFIGETARAQSLGNPFQEMEDKFKKILQTRIIRRRAEVPARRVAV